MAKVIVSRGALDLSGGFPFAIQRTGQSVTGSFSAHKIVIQLPGGGTGTYGGDFYYVGAAIQGGSTISSYAHDSPTLAYKLSLSEFSGAFTVSDYLGYLDAGKPIGLRNDLLSGHDELIGGSGADTLYGWTGDDTVTGNGGSDALFGGDGDDRVRGGGGNDSLDGGDGIDKLTRDDGNDRFAGGKGNDAVEGGAGDDTLDGGTGADSMNGGDGDDLLSGADGNDSLAGAAGNDTLDGGTGLDRLTGGAGNDTYIVAQTGDVVSETISVERVRVSTKASGAQVNADSFLMQLSADGSKVTFSSVGRFVDGDDSGTNDIFVKDLRTQEIVRFNGSFSASSEISADGRYVAFAMTEGNQRMYVRDLETDELTLATSTSDGTAANGWTWIFSLSGNGRYVAFSTEANNLFPGDTNEHRDLFVKDVQSGELVRVSTDSHDDPSEPSMSGDGRYVAFSSNGSIFVKDLEDGSLAKAVRGTPGGSSHFSPHLSADGRFLSFLRTDSLPGYPFPIAFVKDLQTGQVLQVSTALNGGLLNNGGVQAMEMSADGRFIGIHTEASNLVAGDTNGKYDVFLLANPLAGPPSWGAGDAGGRDIVKSSVSFVLPDGVENLTLTGTARIDGAGNALRNKITGNGTANQIDGGAGKDVMSGGGGSDTYIVSQQDDVVRELANQGTDLVKSSVSYTLPDHVEKLTLTGSADINGTGNSLANVLTGNSGNNTLSGMGGEDVLNGREGDDTLVWQAADRFDGGDGIDTLSVRGTGVSLNLQGVLDDRILNIEKIDLTGAGNNHLKLTVADLLALSSTGDTLTVDGDAGDTVTDLGSAVWES